MSRIILHRAMGSPAARSVQMLADIVDLKLQIKEVNIIKMEHKTPEFKKLNPMQTVPVIEDGDFVLSESDRDHDWMFFELQPRIDGSIHDYPQFVFRNKSHAIMKYLLSKYGEAHRERLYPSELQTRAIVDQCMYFNAGVFFRALLNCAGETLMGKLSEPTAQHKADIESSYGILEAYLSSRAYLAADRLTLADLAAGSTVTAVQYMHKVDQDKFPKCTDWVARLEEESFFKTVNKEGAVYFGKLLNAFWKKNKMAKAQ